MISCRADLFRNIQPKGQLVFDVDHVITSDGRRIPSVTTPGLEGNVTQKMIDDINADLAFLGFWRHLKTWRKDFNSAFSYQTIIEDVEGYLNKNYSAHWDHSIQDHPTIVIKKK